MTYIRIKKINDSPYAYLVETVKTSKGPRQKVKKYLGRVFEVESSGQRKEVSASSKKAFLLNLVKEELACSNFTSLGLTLEGVRVIKGKKEVVVRLHEGHLCSFTLSRILNFRKSENIEKDGYTLAKLFLDAGLTIGQEEFVGYYGL